MKSNKNKPKDQLLIELADMRRRIIELEVKEDVKETLAGFAITVGIKGYF
jgi:hypothetical protein